MKQVWYLLNNDRIHKCHTTRLKEDKVRCNFQGRPISSQRATYERCVNLCAHTSNCFAFTYFEYNGQRNCFLQSIIGVKATCERPSIGFIYSRMCMNVRAPCSYVSLKIE